VKPPVFRTSTFEFSRATEGAKFFQRAYHLPGDDGQEPGLVYSRLNNPNTEIFEDKMVALEANATHAAAFPSGTRAITTAVLALVPQGGRILYSDPVYGGTYFFLTHLFPERCGITTVGVDTSDLAHTEELLRTNSPFDMVFLETPANPTAELDGYRGGHGSRASPRRTPHAHRGGQHIPRAGLPAALSARG
jgi:methionine-gamma-lyase